VQVIAAGIVIGIILHAGTHLACDFPRLVNLPETIYEVIFLDRDFGNEKPSYMELVKGIEGVTGILMVMLMAVAFILATRWFRRSLIKLPKPFGRLSGFNAFWYSHHLFVAVYALLIVHGTFLYLAHKWYHKTVYILNFQVIFNLPFTKSIYITSLENIEFDHACRHGCILQFQF
jgi:respiratory burst oxidase